MRLNCPNCGAQYEVQDDVIPAAGRDVECSNCGNTWFQIHPESDVELAVDLGATVPDDEWTPELDERVGDTPSDDRGLQADTDHDAGDSGAIEAPDATPDPEGDAVDPDRSEDHDDGNGDGNDTTRIGSSISPADDTDDDQRENAAPVPEDHGGRESAAGSDLEAIEETDDGDEPDEATMPDVPQPTRRGLDPALADMLRQEADHEVRAREAESGGLEMQPDLGLEEPRRSNETERRARQARERMARLRGTSEPDPVDDATVPTTPDAAPPAHSGSRRELLPDIEDINATLRSAEDRRPSERVGVGATAAEKHRRGFRLGFGLVFLASAGAVLTYIYHAQIIAAYPQATPYIEAYMAWIRETRLWLDTHVTGMMLYLDNLSESSDS